MNSFRLRACSAMICLLFLPSLVLSDTAHAQGRTRVRGYVRKDGTYVAPHWRTLPDGIKSNNYSYPGNFNPNKGEITPIPGNDVWVNGYFRSDGTYVNGHYRSAPMPTALPKVRLHRSPSDLSPFDKPQIQLPMDVSRVQTRLKELGYYGMKVDGIWGTGSKAALRSFKFANLLPSDSFWDLQTEAKLFSPDVPVSEGTSGGIEDTALPVSSPPDRTNPVAATARQSTFSVGSDKEIVLRLQGTPQSLNKYEALGQEVWSYGFSTITIGTRDARVIEWNNAEGNLRAYMEPGSNATDSAFYTVGSHRDDVLRLQGTPTAINRYEALGQEVWSYGFSTVTIGTRDQRVIEWNNSDGKLRVHL
jgi:peptidoglycan hydrolase-like protein with peptidoglycan-binding domain